MCNNINSKDNEINLLNKLKLTLVSCNVKYEQLKIKKTTTLKVK